MTRSTFLVKSVRWGGRLVVLAAFAAGVVVVMLWLAGRFAPKVPATLAGAPAQAAEINGNVEPVRLVRLPLYESAVGTVRAVHETTIGSKLLARVMEVNLKAGQKVHAGDILVRLNDTDLEAKLQQAKAAVASIEAVLRQAVLDEKRYGQLVQSRAASRQEYEKVVTALRSAEADLHRAEEAVNEVQATLDWATIRASPRRNHHRQEGQRGRHGHSRPDVADALRSQAYATCGQRARVADASA